MADDTSATYPDDCVYNTHHVWARLVKEPRLKGIVTLVDNKPPKPSKSRKPAKGKVAEEVLRRDPGYYGWIMNGDFPLNTKQVLTRIKLRGKK